MTPQEVVTFKSNSKNFKREISGKKCNTFRKIDESDNRFKLLRNGCDRIRIVNNSSQEYFERNISDYTEFNGYAIISWESQSLKAERLRLKEEIKNKFDELITFLDCEKQYDFGKVKVSSVIRYVETTQSEVLALLEEKK